jgi:hypothetical protein
MLPWLPCFFIALQPHTALVFILGNYNCHRLFALRQNDPLLFLNGLLQLAAESLFPFGNAYCGTFHLTSLMVPYFDGKYILYLIFQTQAPRLG